MDIDNTQAEDNNRTPMVWANHAGSVWRWAEPPQTSPASLSSWRSPRSKCKIIISRSVLWWLTYPVFPKKSTSTAFVSGWGICRTSKLWNWESLGNGEWRFDWEQAVTRVFPARAPVCHTQSMWHLWRTVTATHTCISSIKLSIFVSICNFWVLILKDNIGDLRSGCERSPTSSRASTLGPHPVALSQEGVEAFLYGGAGRSNYSRQ